MIYHRDRRGRPARRACRPVVGDALERRDLMTTLTPAAVFLQRRAMLAEQLRIGQRGTVDTAVTAAGSAVTVTDTDGERYRVQVSNGGAVTSTALPDGRIALVVRGTNTLSEVDVIPLPRPRARGGAHTFGPFKAFGDGVLDIGLLDVYGPVRGIFGYNTAKLSGPLIVRDSGTVDRIAVTELEPGALVSVGGTLNQLEIRRGADFAGADTGIAVGLDLNVLNVGGNLTINDGAAVRIGRDLGRLGQTAQGTGRGGQGALIDGNIVIGEGSELLINRDLAGPLVVLGNFVGAERFRVTNPPPAGLIQVFGEVVS